MKTQGLNDLLQKRFSILLAVGIFILSVQAWSIEANIDDSQNGGRRAEYSVVIEPDSVVLQIVEYYWRPEWNHHRCRPVYRSETGSCACDCISRSTLRKCVGSGG